MAPRRRATDQLGRSNVLDERGSRRQRPPRRGLGAQGGDVGRARQAQVFRRGRRDVQLRDVRALPAHGDQDATDGGRQRTGRWKATARAVHRAGHSQGTGHTRPVPRVRHHRRRNPPDQVRLPQHPRGGQSTRADRVRGVGPTPDGARHRGRRGRRHRQHVLAGPRRPGRHHIAEADGTRRRRASGVGGRHRPAAGVPQRRGRATNDRAHGRRAGAIPGLRRVHRDAGAGQRHLVGILRDVSAHVLVHGSSRARRRSGPREGAVARCSRRQRRGDAGVQGGGGEGHGGVERDRRRDGRRRRARRKYGCRRASRERRVRGGDVGVHDHAVGHRQDAAAGAVGSTGGCVWGPWGQAHVLEHGG